MAEYNTRSIIDITEDSFTVLSGSVSLVNNELVFSGAGCCRFTYNYNTDTNRLITDSMLVKYKLHNSDSSLSSRYTDTFKIKIYVKYFSQVESNGQISYTDGPSCTYQVYPYYDFEYLGYKDKVTIELKNYLIKSIIIELESTTSSTANLITLCIYNEQTIDEKITETTTESLLDKEYPTLETTDKTVIGAINEVYLSGVRNFTITSESQLTGLTSARPGDTATLCGWTQTEDVGDIDYWSTPEVEQIDGNDAYIENRTYWNCVRNEFVTYVASRTNSTVSHILATSEDGKHWQSIGITIYDAGSPPFINDYNQTVYGYNTYVFWDHIIYCDDTKALGMVIDGVDNNNDPIGYKWGWLNFSDYSFNTLQGDLKIYKIYAGTNARDDRTIIKTSSGRFIWLYGDDNSPNFSIAYSDNNCSSFTVLNNVPLFLGTNVARYTKLCYDNDRDRIYICGVDKVYYADASSLSTWVELGDYSSSHYGDEGDYLYLNNAIYYLRNYGDTDLYKIDIQYGRESTVDISAIKPNIDAEIFGFHIVNNNEIWVDMRYQYTQKTYKLSGDDNFEIIYDTNEHPTNTSYRYVTNRNGVVIAGTGMPLTLVSPGTITRGAWILVSNPTNRNNWLRIDNSI